MAKFFECTAQYEKVNDNTGKIETVKGAYLTEAETFGEAEDKILTYVAQELNVAPEMVSERVYKLNSVQEPDAGTDKWYYVKVAWEDVNEKGKPTTYKEEHLLPAQNTNEALLKVTKFLDDTLADYEITSVGKSKIIGVAL